MTRAQIEELLYGKPNEERRFTQDFPILPDVWIAYAGATPGNRVSLLLTPHNRSSAAKLIQELRERLHEEPASAKAGRARLLYNESVALADLSFEEMLRVALPLTDWWAKTMHHLDDYWVNGLRARLRELIAAGPGHSTTTRVDVPLLRRFIHIVGAIVLARRAGSEEVGPSEDSDKLIDAFATVFRGFKPAKPHQTGLLWSICCNRRAHASVYRSRLTVKADAAARLFETKAAGIRWAILDTGVDARHPAFQKCEPTAAGQPTVPDAFPVPAAKSRVTHTYDFLKIQDLLDPGPEGDKVLKEIIGKRSKSPTERKKLNDLRDDLRRSLQRGRAIDWDLLEPFLRIPHDKNYVPPEDSHGTHVAGIIAAHWPNAADSTPLNEGLFGICPEIEIYDLRVLGKNSDEFTIIAALQFLRHLNAHKDVMVIHGVNLSLSVPHDVANFACGRTPVCEECERVVAGGVVVVTAAGNRGFNKLAQADAGALGDYRYISITDPGNADGVITVGATHRLAPHTYGVSYFSSRGPTGDGRTKPDLVAPGERIDSCSLNGYYETMDGTSMAAPHVSGAAALLLARNTELMGQPRRIKEILVKTATDLGREPRFQGSGNLDVLRALQSV
jgi:serine protease AprX